MNYNKIKIMSIAILLLFAGLFAVPFLAHTSCDITDYNESCDMMDMAGENCFDTMTECSVVSFQPVISAPLNKVELQKNLNVDYYVFLSDNFNIIEEYTLLQVVSKLCISESHPGFQIPLLV